MTNDAPKTELDARGLLCPLPVLKARKRLSGLEPGEVLRLLADDPAAPLDVMHFCAEQGHVLVRETRGEAGGFAFDIRKGDPSLHATNEAASAG